MSTLQLKINHKFFNIACDPGQEEDLRTAANNLNTRLEKIYKMLPSATPDLAMVVVALIMQDEISSYAKNPDIDKDDFKIVSTLDSITKYIEELALNLENC
jgi:cell division protein ZapA (FtsZ GTPase activity inhibitor)